MVFHPARGHQILSSVVATTSAGYPMSTNAIEEQLEDRLSAVVVVRSKTDNQPRFAVDKAVDDNFPTDEACGLVK